MKRKFGIALLLLAVVTLALPVVSHAQVAVGLSVRIGPPVLPVYAQPICPGPGYIWTPGYWAYGEDGYYWVPGTWVLPPQPGLLWTPGYWGFAEGVYVWHRGYWGPHVGFYGGIAYGFGYPGTGFYGGEWRHGAFFYNRSVVNVNVVTVRNVYERRVDFREGNRVSFNGRGGIERRPDRDEMRWEHERHWDPTPDQDHHRDFAAHDRNQWNSVNHGRPGFAATPRAGEFDHRDADRGDRGERENREMRQDNRELRHNNAEMRQNNRELRQNNREVHQNNREMRQNNREQRQQNRENGRPGKPDKDHGHPHGRGL
ncbi:MAG TPA: hypothetical protein VFU57_07530 [Candidatus Acidoferrales bacterium]|nr:hypothetical protein [Candidatus Acidoferrales bacterium]